MSLVTLPAIIEQQFAAYIAANIPSTYQKTTPDGAVTGQYTVARGFTTAAYALPLIVVKAGKLKEIEPQTFVYEGSLLVSVITQVDDTIDDPVAVHDLKMGEVYDALANQAALTAAVNGSNFHLWSLYSTSYEQDIATADDKRSLVSFLEYTLNCQTQPVS